MELRFVQPTLASLDELEQEVFACAVWSDVRPMHGAFSLCDWRTAGKLSTLLKRGFIEGTPGEVVMVSGRPALPFDKLLFFGAGERRAFDEEVFRRVCTHMLRVFEGLCTRAGVIELPGRADDLIEAERAADLFLDAAGRRREHDVCTLVEHADGKARILAHMIQQRRRVRREG